jgi:hypothetical protein
LDFDEQAEYKIKIDCFEFEVKLLENKQLNQKRFTIPAEYRDKFSKDVEYKVEINKH